MINKIFFPGSGIIFLVIFLAALITCIICFVKKIKTASIISFVLVLVSFVYIATGVGFVYKKPFLTNGKSNLATGLKEEKVGKYISGFSNIDGFINDFVGTIKLDEVEQFTGENALSKSFGHVSGDTEIAIEKYTCESDSDAKAKFAEIKDFAEHGMIEKYIISKNDDNYSYSISPYCYDISKFAFPFVDTYASSMSLVVRIENECVVIFEDSQNMSVSMLHTLKEKCK